LMLLTNPPITRLTHPTAVAGEAMAVELVVPLAVVVALVVLDGAPLVGSQWKLEGSGNLVWLDLRIYPKRNGLQGRHA
jgi:hypothetical protein